MSTLPTPMPPPGSNPNPHLNRNLNPAPPLSDSDLSALLPRLATLAEQVALLRASPLLAEEPSLPSSLEERP